MASNAEKEYRVELSRQAEKFLEKLSKDYYRLVSDHLIQLKTNTHPPGSVNLKNTTNEYRLRVGVYRILYSVIIRS